MTAREVLDNFVDEQGWDEEAMLAVLLAFIDKHELTEELEEHLQTVAELENAGDES